MKTINYKTIATLSLLVFVFLLGFSFSVQAYRINQQELKSPVSQYLRENYGVNSIEEYEAKLEQEIWLNISRQMEALASEYPEINFSEWQNPYVYRQYGTSTYQPPKIASQLPFYMAIFSEPVTALQVFSLSGLGLIGLAAVPPIRKNKRLKQALVLGVVILCVFSVGYFTGYVVAQTGLIAIEPASLSGDYSYLIETDGTYVWAKSGKTGEVVYGGQWNAGGVSGTNAAAVIQSAINALTPNRTWKEWIVLKGDFTINSIIYVPSYTGIDMSSARLTLGADIDAMFRSHSQEGYSTEKVYYVHFRGGKLYGNMTNRTKGSGIQGNFNYGVFEDIWFSSFKDWGINIRGYSGKTAIANTFIKCLFEAPAWSGGQGALYFENAGAGVCDSMITNCWFINHGAIQIKLDDSCWLHQIVGCHFTGTGSTTGKAIYARGDVRRVGIFDCEFENCAAEAILVETTTINKCSDHWRIIGNTFIDNCKAAHNTYSVIKYSSTSSTSGGVRLGVIEGNTFYSGQTNKAKYAIELAGAGSCYHRVMYNVIQSATYATAAIYNEGTANIIKFNYNYVTENGGTATFSGTGSQTTFTIAHGLARTPKVVVVTAGSSDAKGDFYVTYDATNIYVTYTTAPPSGTNNVVLNWYAEM